MVDAIKDSVEYLTYSIRRYKVPVSQVLIYTEVDISELIEKTKRLTDVCINVKIGDSYFHFILLPFTDTTQSYSFIKNLERKVLTKIQTYYHCEMLEPEIHNYFNFVNSFLFQILARKKEEKLI